MTHYVPPPDDLLTDLLTEANLRARFVGFMAATGSRGFRFPGIFDAALHVVISGIAWVKVDGEVAKQVERGDVTLMPKDAPSSILGSPDAEPFVPPPGRVAPRVARVRAGEPDAMAFSVLTVACEYQNPRCRPLLGALPYAMHFRLSDDALDAAERIATGSGRGSPGSDFTTQRQAEGLFCEVVALAISRLDAPTSWLPAMRDKYMAPVLHAIHTKPAERWSLQRLARLAGLSRAAFCRRFSALTGMSVAEYIRQHRVRCAISMLRDGTLSIAEVADAVGYESESSFSRAFVAVTGKRPGATRVRPALSLANKLR